MKNKSFTIIMVCLLSGCALLPFKKGKAETPPPVISTNQKIQKSIFQKMLVWKKKGNPKVKEKTGIVKQGSKVVDPLRLRKGGNLVIIPFRAGVGIEANVELNKISLHMVKGIFDFLEEHNSPFHLLFDDNAREADLMMEGHITEIQNKSKLRQWTFRDNKCELSIEGRLIDQKTGKDIVILSETQKEQDQKQTCEGLGYDLGRRIGAILIENL